MGARDVALVAVGGAVGAGARDAVEQALGAHPHGVPLATLVINLTGALALGLLLGAFGQRHRLRLLLGVGVCGGYTTYSTLAMETVQLGRHGHAPTAVLYACGSAVGGLVAAGAGLRVGARWT